MNKTPNVGMEILLDPPVNAADISESVIESYLAGTETAKKVFLDQIKKRIRSGTDTNTAKAFEELHDFVSRIQFNRPRVKFGDDA